MFRRRLKYPVLSYPIDPIYWALKYALLFILLDGDPFILHQEREEQVIFLLTQQNASTLHHMNILQRAVILIDFYL